MSVPSGFDDVLAAAQKLPACDRAAKLHALIARVLQATSIGGSQSAAAEALAAAAAEALASDPWVQFEMAARRFSARAATAAPPPVGEHPLPAAAPSGLA